METQTLKHANATVAQTWNHLSINDIKLEVPAAPTTPKAEAPAPAFASIEMGAGEELTAWLDASAASRKAISVPPSKELQDVVVTVDDIRATDVSVPEGTHARIVVIVPPAADGATLGHALRIQAESGATVELCEVVAAGKATYLSDTGVRLADGAHAEVRHFLLDADTCVVGLACDLAGARSGYEQATRYLAGPGQRVDMNYLARMRGTDSRARLGFSGVLEEGARKRLADTIDLIHGGKGAKGSEDETVLVNGAHIRNLSLPSVLCDEEDVEGTHGATIGSISGEQLDYLRCHGLSDEEARGLFVRSVFDDCLERVPVAREQTLAAARRVISEADAAELAEESEAKANKEGMR